MKSIHQKRPTLRLVTSDEEFNHGAWRHGEVLVVSEHATLPDRCIKCNAPAEGYLYPKTLLWHTPLIIPLVVLNFILYALCAFLTRKTMKMQMPLCNHHLRRRRGLAWTGHIMLAAFPILIGFGIYTSQPPFVLVGLFLGLVGFALSVIGRNEIWPSRLTPDLAFVRGVDPKWLAALPEWPGERE